MNPLLMILGPTASGKTDLSLRIANFFGGEIISADSRQIYFGMNIGTAKAGVREHLPSSRYDPLHIRRIPHYFIDIITPDQSYSVSEFSSDAASVIEQILQRNNLPIVAGGTGFYARVLAGDQKISNVPPDPAFRAWAQKQSTSFLLSRIADQDPKAAARVALQDRRRVIRALEIISHPQTTASSRSQTYNTVKIALSPNRDELRKRIKQRTDDMFKKGLIEEVKELVAKYGKEAPGLQTIGYREIFPFLDGTITKSEAQERVFHATWQYARRQLTWLNREPQIHWVTTDDEVDALLQSKFLSK